MSEVAGTTSVTDEPMNGAPMNPSHALSAEQINALMGPLHPARVAHRSQGGRDLSYLEAYDVKASLIRVFGFGGFDSEVLKAEVVKTEHRAHPNNPERMIWDVTALVTLRLSIHATWSIYTETAASMQSNPDFGEALDFAVKTAESDALKRAAINLGTQFGLSLYDNGSTREIVRVLFDPDQAAMLKRPETPGTPEQHAAVAGSVGANLGQQADAQTPSVTDEANAEAPA